MDQAIHCRPAAPDDAEAVVEIISSVPWLVEAFPGGVSPDRVRRHLETCLAQGDYLALVAEHGGRAAAYCTAHLKHYLMMPAPECYLAELFVRAEARGRGLGGALLERVEAWAGERGCYRLMLMTGNQHQAYRRRFYAERGWQERPQVSNFIRMLGS